MLSQPLILETPTSTLPSDAAKAIVLAAGKDAGSLLTKRLGDRTIVECVLANLAQIVPPEDIYLVTDAAQAPLANGYRHVVQESPLGTGHAVLQVAPELRDYRGKVLILYGDTPLVRSGSLLGLINRHNLRQAHLTLLTAVVDRPLPYGRIIRNAAGTIIDIIEEKEASADVRGIRELNVGAYVVDASVLFAALERLSPSPADGEYRLTDCVHALIRSGLRVESYRIYRSEERRVGKEC